MLFFSIVLVVLDLSDLKSSVVMFSVLVCISMEWLNPRDTASSVSEFENHACSLEQVVRFLKNCL